MAIIQVESEAHWRATISLIREQWLPKPIDEAFAFFSRPGNLEEITPPWMGFHIVHTDPRLHAGSLIKYKLRIRGLPMRWTSEIAVWDPPHRFVDNQVRGPYKRWHHGHSFLPENGGTRIRMKSLAVTAPSKAAPLSE